MSVKLAAPLLALAIGALFGGCADEPLYGGCSYGPTSGPNESTINKNCNHEDGTALFTCVVELHPQCPQDVCLQWKNSEPFCTRRCASDDECPGGTCETYSSTLGKFYCVSDAIRDNAKSR